jgi:hypothetical protein
MKLSIGVETTAQGYGILLTIYHKNTCILRSDCACLYVNSTNCESIKLLESKLNETCMHNAPLELFSDENGSSTTMTFANGGFIYARTITPANELEVTTSNIYLLRPEELLQFYCEFRKLLGIVREAKSSHMVLRPSL